MLIDLECGKGLCFFGPSKKEKLFGLSKNEQQLRTRRRCRGTELLSCSWASPSDGVGTPVLPVEGVASTDHGADHEQLLHVTSLL